MFATTVSWISVIVAALLYMCIGALWYSPYLFGKFWQELSGIREEELGSIGWMYFVTFLTSLLTAYVLADIISLLHAESIGDGILFGFWIWLGIIATTTLHSVLFGKKSLSLYFIDNGYYVLSFMVMGGLFAIWP